MVKKGAVVLLIGLPASGKSTFAENLCNYFNREHSFNPIKPFLIKFDALINIEQQANLINQPQKWKETRNLFFQTFQAFLDLILDMPSSSHNNKVNYFLSKLLDNNSIDAALTRFLIIVEDNFYYRSMRQPFYRAAKSRSIGFGVIMLKINLEKCLERNKFRKNDYIFDHVIIKMNQIFEEPNPFDLNFVDNKSLIITDESKEDMEKIVNFIEDLIQNPLIKKKNDKNEKEQNQNKLINKQNLNHQFDNLLRRAIKKLMKSEKKENDGHRLSLIKKKILNKFKQNPSLFPDWLSRELISDQKENEKAFQYALNLIETQFLKKM